MFNIIGTILSIAFYALCGYLAGLIMKTNYKWYINVTISVIGSFILKIVLGLVGFGIHNIIAETIVCTLGGCLFIYLYNKFFKK